MAKTIGSSLDKNRVNSLPNVYHRPQAGSGVIVEPVNREVRTDKDYFYYEHRLREMENPNRSWAKDFEGRGIDSQYICSRLVIRYNHAHRKDASDVVYAKKAYLEMFEHLNLCWKCKQPIRVRKGSVKFTPTVHNIYAPVVRKMAVLSKERKVESSDGVEYADAGIEEFVYKREKHTLLGATRVGREFYPESQGNNYIVADIASHFEVRQTADGKLVYRYIDGTERHLELRYKEITLRVKRKKFGKLRNVTRTRKIPYIVHVHADGSFTDAVRCKCDTCVTLENPLPLTYRIEQKQCACKKR